MFSQLEGGQFPCTDDCQVTFVNLKCDSSKKRRRGRKSTTKEVSYITAELEMEMKDEEISGVLLFSHVSPQLQTNLTLPTWNWWARIGLHVEAN